MLRTTTTLVLSLAACSCLGAAQEDASEVKIPAIDDWTAADVGRWVESMLASDETDLGAEEDKSWYKWGSSEAPDGIGAPFVKNGVDGMLLMHLEISDLSSELGLSPLKVRLYTLHRQRPRDIVPLCPSERSAKLTAVTSDRARALALFLNQAKKLMLKIDELKTRISSNPQDMFEYRAANRKYVDLMGTWMMAGPRGPLLWLRLKDYDSVWRPAFHALGGVAEGESSGGGATGFWVGWLLAPEIVVIFSATNFTGLHPILAGWIIIAFSIRTFLYLVLAARNRAGFFVGFLTLAVGAEIGGAFLTGFWWLLYPIVPWFFCDVGFYGLVIFAPFNVIAAYNAMGNNYEVYKQA